MSDDPYSPPPSQDTPTGSWADVLQRAIVLIMYLVVWAIVAFLTGPVLNATLGGFEIGRRPPDSELTLMESFNRFATMYWFTAFIMIGVPIGFVAWFVLRRKRVGPTRWTWLAICSALVLPEMILAWLLFRPLLFAGR